MASGKTGGKRRNSLIPVLVTGMSNAAIYHTAPDN
jgi:hypothetical protein